jgi:xylose isomerase
MDSFARGLKAAQKMLEDGILEEFISERYKSYKMGIGKKIMERKVDFKSLEEYALGLKEIKNSSGRQEYLESLLNEYILNVK